MAQPKRIGALVPSTNQVVEPDFNMMAPKGVTVLAERMWLGGPSEPGGGDGSELMDMNADIPRASRYVASAGVDAIAYACTSGTYRTGTIDYSREIGQAITKETGLPSIVALEASIEALNFVGARRLSLAGPYGDLLLKERLKPLLESEGFEVVSAEGEPEMKQRTQAVVIGNQDPELILNFVASNVAAEADTVFLPGTAWRAVEVVEELEKRLGKTVITVNQATFWKALRTLGVTEPVQGFGRLLASSRTVAS